MLKFTLVIGLMLSGFQVWGARADVTCDKIPTPHHVLNYCYSDAAGRARSSDVNVDILYYFPLPSGEICDFR